MATPLTAHNDFTMPAIITPEAAAAAIVRGWEDGEFDIHFPKRFTRWMKWLRLLPYRWYFSGGAPFYRPSKTLAMEHPLSPQQPRQKKPSPASSSF